MDNMVKMVAADVSEQGRMFYLIDGNYDFLSEVKEFLDWKFATQRAPATIKAYCTRLYWYYCFLAQRNLRAFEAKPQDLTEFVIWLCNPYRMAEKALPYSSAQPTHCYQCKSHSSGCRGSLPVPGTQGDPFRISSSVC